MKWILVYYRLSQKLYIGYPSAMSQCETNRAFLYMNNIFIHITMLQWVTFCLLYCTCYITFSWSAFFSSKLSSTICSLCVGWQQMDREVNPTQHLYTQSIWQHSSAPPGLLVKSYDHTSHVTIEPYYCLTYVLKVHYAVLGGEIWNSNKWK